MLRPLCWGPCVGALWGVPIGFWRSRMWGRCIRSWFQRRCGSSDARRGLAPLGGASAVARHQTKFGPGGLLPRVPRCKLGKDIMCYHRRRATYPGAPQTHWSRSWAPVKSPMEALKELLAALWEERVSQNPADQCPFEIAALPNSARVRAAAPLSPAASAPPLVVSGA